MTASELIDEDALHLPRVIAGKLVGKVNRNALPLLDREELTAIGLLAMVESAGRYIPGKVPFLAYARRRVEGAMLDSMRLPGTRSYVPGVPAHPALRMRTEHPRDEDGVPLDLLIEKDNPESILLRKEKLQKLQDKLNTLNPRYRKVIEMSLSGQLLEDIAADMHVDRSRAAQLQQAALAKIRRLRSTCQYRRKVA